MPRKKPDNVQFIVDLMNHSQYGALAQIFVFDALSKWSDIIAGKKPEDVESGLIAGAAWIGVAKEIKQKLDERLGS